MTALRRFGWEGFQACPISADVSQDSILGPTIFYNDLLNDLVCNVAIYADDTTLFSKCDQASELWQQVEFSPGFESDLRGIVQWGRKCLVNLNARNTRIDWLDCLNNFNANDVKLDASVLGEN